MPPEKLTPIGARASTRARSATATSRSRRRARRCSAGRSRRDRRQRAALRREEARVDRVGIRTADERELDDVVRRHHAGVARMELRREPGVVERPLQRVDAIGDEQRRALVPLRQEVAHRPIQRARHPDRRRPRPPRARRSRRSRGRPRDRRRARGAAPRRASCCGYGSAEDRADRRCVLRGAASGHCRAAGENVQQELST